MVEKPNHSKQFANSSGNAQKSFVPNVGIGTTTPTSTLQVAGTSMALTSSSGAVAYLTATNSSNNGLLWLQDSTSTNQVKINTSGTSYFNGGNVGIGTTSPTQALHLSSGSTLTTAIRLDNTDAGGRNYSINSTGSAAGIGVGKFSIYDSTAALHRLTIDSSGNVGIGTTSPATQLANTSINTLDAIWGYGLGANSIGWLANGTGWVQSLRQDSSVAGAMGQLVSIAGTATSNSILQLESGGTNRMIVRGDGNVGIGTASPLRQLHIANTAGWTESILENTTLASGTLGRIWTQSNDGAGRYVLRAADGSISSNVAPFATYSNGSVAVGAFYSGTAVGSMPTNGMIVQGNVGIGTTSPGYKLDVQGGDINASGSVRAAGVALTSDIRYKRDIEPLDNALEKILNLRGISYNWRVDEFPQKQFNDRHQIGVIAQEVEKQFPEVVDTNQDGYKSVNYPALVAPLIEAVKTLYNRLTGVEAIQGSQERRIANVEASKADKTETEALRAENVQLKARANKAEQDNAAKTKELQDVKARLDKIEKMLNSK